MLAVPVIGNGKRGGWPIIQIQCATGAIEQLEAKLAEGANTFGTVWENGFYRGSRIRAVATPDDLLKLQDVHWSRLGETGWVIDRTRLAHLGSHNRQVPLLPEVELFWNDLSAVKTEIDWQTGWQQSS